MTNSKDCCSMSPAEFDLFPSRMAYIGAEGSSSRMYAVGQNGGTSGMSMAKENGRFGIGVGVGLAEKRARDGDGSVSPAAVSVHFGAGPNAQRGFQNIPEAPPRKRVQVGGSSSSQLNATKGLHSPFVLEETVNRVNTGGMSDSELDRRLPARHPRTPLRSESIIGDIGGQDADVAADVGHRRASGSLNVEDVEEDVADGEEHEEEEEEGEEAELPNPATDGVTDMDVDVILPNGVEPEGSPWLEVEDDAQLPVPPREARSRGAEAEAGIQMDGSYFPETTGVKDEAVGNFFYGTPPAPVNGENGVKKEHDDRGRDHRAPAPADRRGCIEIIEVEDSDDEIAEMNVHESDESSTKGKKPERMNMTDQQRRGHMGGHRASPSRSNGSDRVRHRVSPSQFTGSYNPIDEDDDGDSDDCQVLESIPPPRYGQRDRPRDGPSNPVVVDDDEEEEEEDDEEDNREATSLGLDGSDSDEEVVVVGQPEIRRQWEEAAMRRSLGRVLRSEGSKANGDLEGGTVNHDDDKTESQGLEESVATSTYQGSPDSKDQTETSEARGGLDGYVNHRSDGQQGASTSSMRAARTATGAAAEDVVPGPVELRQPFLDLNEVDDSDMEIRELFAAGVAPRPRAPEANGSHRVDNGEALLDERLPESGEESDGGEDSLADGLSAGGTYSTSLPHGAGSLRAGNGTNGAESHHKQQANLGDDLRRKGDAVELQEGVVPLGEDVGVTGTDDGDLLAAKDRLKESLHYKNSDAAEWASRQKEIQRQAVEVKRLKQRKKQEADRKKEMERKQKERIEELRLSQKKEERNMDMREQMRGQIRSELERVAARCHDFATLLRQLGVSVEGGNQPSVQQVNAAYKKALFKFHPDRAVASSKGDPRQQVEAEEKFKLITRLKDTLVKPVTADYGFTYPQQFR